MNTINPTQNEIDDDTIEISKQALKALVKTSLVTENTNTPLDDLVRAGTITRDQANAIKDVFKAAI